MSVEKIQTSKFYGLVLKPTKENEETLYVLANGILTCTSFEQTLTSIKYKVDVTAYQNSRYRCEEQRTSFEFKCERFISESKWRLSTSGLFLNIYFAKNRGVGKWVMVSLFNTLKELVDFDDLDEISFKLTDAQAKTKEEMTLRNQFYRTIGCIPYVFNEQTTELELGNWETLEDGRAVLPIDQIPSKYNEDKIAQMSVEDMIKHLLKSQASLVAENEELNSKYAFLKGDVEPLRKFKEKCDKIRFILGVVAFFVFLVVIALI
ncbi:hypothetical protein [Alteromonas sp. S167]|uniref:hypothetical protein n=1 Tax=Alteromonas sp. S167 TaxID=3117402 RepID=UPI002FE04286